MTSPDLQYHQCFKLNDNPFEGKDVADLTTEEKSLQKIVVDGWDSTEWADGQNLLHFLCERLGSIDGLES